MENFYFGNQYVKFAFPKSPSIYYLSNKEYIWQFHLLEMYMKKHFFYSENIRVTVGRYVGGGWVRIFTAQWPLSVAI